MKFELQKEPEKSFSVTNMKEALTRLKDFLTPTPKPSTISSWQLAQGQEFVVLKGCEKTFMEEFSKTPVESLEFMWLVLRVYIQCGIKKEKSAQQFIFKKEAEGAKLFCNTWRKGVMELLEETPDLEMAVQVLIGVAQWISNCSVIGNAKQLKLIREQRGIDWKLACEEMQALAADLDSEDLKKACQEALVRIAKVEATESSGKKKHSANTSEATAVDANTATTNSHPKAASAPVVATTSSAPAPTLGATGISKGINSQKLGQASRMKALRKKVSTQVASANMPTPGNASSKTIANTQKRGNASSEAPRLPRSTRDSPTSETKAFLNNVFRMGGANTNGEEESASPTGIRDNQPSENSDLDSKPAARTEHDTPSAAPDVQPAARSEPPEPARENEHRPTTVDAQRRARRDYSHPPGPQHQQQQRQPRLDTFDPYKEAGSSRSQQATRSHGQGRQHHAEATHEGARPRRQAAPSQGYYPEAVARHSQHHAAPPHGGARPPQQVVPPHGNPPPQHQRHQDHSNDPPCHSGQRRSRDGRDAGAERPPKQARIGDHNNSIPQQHHQPPLPAPMGRGRGRTLPAWMTQSGTSGTNLGATRQDNSVQQGPTQGVPSQFDDSYGGVQNARPPFGGGEGVSGQGSQAPRPTLPSQPHTSAFQDNSRGGRGRGRGGDINKPAWMTRGYK